MRNSIRLLVFFVSLIAVNSVLAVDIDRLMESGNDFYEQGQFADAIREYEKILDTDMASTALYYNLGSAYFNEKIYGRAILNFEKAQQLSPRDPDVLHNLEFTKLFLKDRFDLPEPMPFVGWFMDLRKSLSVRELRWLEMLFFSLFVIGIVLYRLFRERSYTSVLLPATIGLGFMLLLTGGWLVDRSISMDEKHAVLLTREANVSSAPIPGSSTLFVIHEGTTAKILDATDTWYEIKLMDGKTGWIINEAVGIF